MRLYELERRLARHGWTVAERGKWQLWYCHPNTPHYVVIGMDAGGELFCRLQQA